MPAQRPQGKRLSKKATSSENQMKTGLTGSSKVLPRGIMADSWRH